MFAYGLMFTILVTFSAIERYNLMYSRYVPILFSMLCVILFTGLRGDVGQDTSNYLLMYSDSLRYKEYLEPGFYSMLSGINQLGFSFNSFLLIVSAISVMFYFAAISKFIPKMYVTLSFLLIFCDLYIYLNISGIRQGLALPICLFASYFALNRRLLPFTTLVLLACSFHKSAFCFIIIYPLLRVSLTFNYKNCFFLILASFSIFILINFYAKSYLDFSFIKGGDMYLSDDYNVLSVDAYIIGFLRRLYPILLFIYFYKVIKNDKVTRSIFNVYLFGFLFYVINYPIFQDVTVRISSYFIIFEAILVVRIFMSLENKINKKIFLLVIYSLIAFKLYTYSSLDAYKYVFFTSFI